MFNFYVIFYQWNCLATHVKHSPCRTKTSSQGHKGFLRRHLNPIEMCAKVHRGWALGQLNPESIQLSKKSSSRYKPMVPYLIGLSCYLVTLPATLSAPLEVCLLCKKLLPLSCSKKTVPTSNQGIVNDKLRIEISPLNMEKPWQVPFIWLVLASTHVCY